MIDIERTLFGHVWAETLRMSMVQPWSSIRNSPNNSNAPAVSRCDQPARYCLRSHDLVEGQEPAISLEEMNLGTEAFGVFSWSKPGAILHTAALTMSRLSDGPNRHRLEKAHQP